MKRILLALVFVATSAQAQVSQAKFDSLVARVALLDSIVGTKKFLANQIPCAAMEQNRPSAWFPNGEYDLAFRNRQFGCAFDPVVTTVGDVAGRFEGMVARMGTLENRIGVVETRPLPIATDVNVSGPTTSIRFTQSAINQNGVGINGQAYGGPATAEIQLGGDAGFRRNSNIAPPVTVDGAGTITIHNSTAFEVTSPVPANINPPNGVIWWASGGNGLKTLAADRMSGTTWSGAYPEGTYTVTKYTSAGQLNPWIPSVKDGHDWEGHFGWQYSQPEKSTFVPTGYGVKGDFLLRLAFNFDTNEYGTGKYDSFYDLNPGRGFDVRLNSDGVYGSITPMFRVSNSGTDVWVDGVLRRLKSCNVGGVLVVCF